MSNTDRKSNQETEMVASRTRQAADAVRKSGSAISNFLALFSLPMIGVYALATLSFFGTYTGLINVLQSGDNNAGTIGVVVVFLFVFVLTVFMVYSLGEMSASGKKLRERVPFLGTYIATMLFSVCFGFAFYWNLLEARQQATRDADAVLTSFDREVRIAIAGLEGAEKRLDALQAEFTERARLEAESGNQCGEVSGGGDGPRARHLRRRADEIRSIVAALRPQISGVLESSRAIQAKIEEVNEIGRASADDTDTNAREQLFREAELAGIEIATDLEALARSTSIQENAELFQQWGAEYTNEELIRTDPDTGASFQCINLAAGATLENIATDLGNLPILPTPELDTYAGPAATREAVDRFVYSVSVPLRSLVRLLDQPTEAELEAAAGERMEREEELRRQRQKLIEAGEDVDDTAGLSVGEAMEKSKRPGIRGEDSMPLILAAFIDGLLFLASFWAKPTEKFSRLGRLIKEVEGETTRPMMLVEAAEELAKDPQFARVMKFRFYHHEEPYLAIPTKAAPGYEADVRVLKAVVIAWEEGGIVTSANLGNGKIKRLLEDEGSPVVGHYEKYVAYRFHWGRFNRMALQEMLRDRSAVAPEALPVGAGAAASGTSSGGSADATNRSGVGTASATSAAPAGAATGVAANDSAPNGTNAAEPSSSEPEGDSGRNAPEDDPQLEHAKGAITPGTGEPSPDDVTKSAPPEGGLTKANGAANSQGEPKPED